MPNREQDQTPATRLRVVGVALGLDTSALEDDGPAGEFTKFAQTGVTVANLLRHPDAHPIALDMLYLQHYGPEWMTWEGETLQHLAPTDFQGQVLSDLNLAKLQACRTLHLVDTYWERWEVFGWCTAAFNEQFPDFEMMQVPSVGQLLVSADIAGRIRDDVAWSDEVKGYMGAVFQHDGVFWSLPPLEFIVVPTERLPFDIEEVKAQWPEARAAGKAPSGDGVVEEQLRRLVAAYQFLEMSREHLREQLRFLGHAAE